MPDVEDVKSVVDAKVLPVVPAAVPPVEKIDPALAARRGAYKKAK